MMSISLVDAFLVIFIIMGGVVGFKNGAIKEGMNFVGIILVALIAFIFKDKLMVVLYENLPFFDFFGLIKGISAVNILFYQLISFIIIFMALYFVLRVLIVITGFIEWLLKLTIFLRVPSKILGIVVGALEFYVYSFIILYIINMPIFGLSLVADSKFGNGILNNTPILSGLVDGTVKTYSDIWDIIENRDDQNTNTEINTLVLVSLLDNKLITVDSARKLVESNKIILTDNAILDNYQSDSNILNELKCSIIDECNN